jgi:hypothetical protein
LIPAVLINGPPLVDLGLVMRAERCRRLILNRGDVLARSSSRLRTAGSASDSTTAAFSFNQGKTPPDSGFPLLAASLRLGA